VVIIDLYYTQFAHRVVE